MFHQTTTNTSLTPSTQLGDPAESPVLVRRKARRLRSSSKDAYSKDIQLFLRFGGTVPADPAVVLRYIELLRGRVQASTAYRRAMALQRFHVDHQHPCPTDDPEVRAAIRCLQSGRFPPKPGSKTAKASAAPVKREPKSAKPLTRALLQRLEEALGRNMLDRRDRALLLLGFSAALKRGALTALDVRDIKFTADAVLVSVHELSDGADPERRTSSANRTIAIPVTGGPLCAATAVKQWIEHVALEQESPVFPTFNRAGEPTHQRLSAAFVSCIVKRRLEIVGVDAKNFSAESLRKGRLLEVPKGAMK